MLNVGVNYFGISIWAVWLAGLASSSQPQPLVLVSSPRQIPVATVIQPLLDQCSRTG